VVDWLDYRVMNARLRVVDALCRPEQETEADGGAIAGIRKKEPGSTLPRLSERK
jgi:hypothetical protein